MSDFDMRLVRSSTLQASGSVELNQGEAETPNIGHAEGPRTGLAALPGARAVRRSAAPQVAARRTGIAGCLRAGLRNLGAKVRSVFTRPPVAYGLAESYSFQVPGHDKLITLPRSAFLGMIADLPKSERAEAVATLQETIQSRLENGHRILRDILDVSKDNLPDPTAQDVADLTLFLQLKAEALGQGFESGAFSIEDPDGRFAHYLERSPDLYLRSSTHLTRFQDETVDGHRNTQRGIDFAKGPRHALPFSRRTVVFGTIPALTDPETGEVKSGRRLYLKPETHGCRISSRSFGATFAPDSYRVDFGADTRPRGWKGSDVGAAIKHGISLLSKRSEGGRREDLPSDLRDELNAFAKKSPELAKKLGVTHRWFKKDPLKGMGIRGFLEGISRLTTKEQLSDEIQGLIGKIVSRWPDKDNLMSRLGDEVLLNRSDLDR